MPGQIVITGIDELFEVCRRYLEQDASVPVS